MHAEAPPSLVAPPPTPGASIPLFREDFSIILGGPFFQLLRQAHMSGTALELLRRRIAVITAVAWLPLLLLTLLAGSAFGGGIAVPFVKDVEVHVRFLVALPLLIVAELVVHQRLRPIADEFLARGIVQSDTAARFHECVLAAMRLRNSRIAELLMVATVYGGGVHLLWRMVTALDVATWYGTPSPDGLRFTAAGYWYVYVSVPVFQFLMLRWYFRMVVWIRFLWQVSRIRLQISAMHGDRMAGLGFMANTVYAFVPLLAAHGALLAGTIANRIFYLGAALVDQKVEIAVVLAFLLVLVLAPLAVFAPQIATAKRAAQRAYGRLAQHYVIDFERRWIPGGIPAPESALGSGDIQSLADLSNSFETVRSTRIVPITRQMVLALAVATLLPVAPLLLTVLPAEQLAKQLLQLLL